MLIHRLSFLANVFALASCSSTSMSDGNGSQSGAPLPDMGDPTEGSPLGPSCERRDPNANSLPGFRWSVSCHASFEMWDPRVAVLGDGGFVLALRVAHDTVPPKSVTMNLGGEDLINAGNFDVVVARFDAEGQHVWSQLWGNEHSEESSAVAALPDGGVALGLRFGGTVNVGGETFTSLAEYDEILINLDAAGKHRWSRRLTPMGVKGWSSIRSVDSAADGSIVMSAYISGTIELVGDQTYVTNQSGANIFALYEPGGGLRRAELHDVDVSAPALSDDGSITFGVVDGLQRNGPDGMLDWTLSGWKRPGPLDAVLNLTHVSCAPNDDIVVAGVFGGTINLGGDDLVNDDFDVQLGNYDLFVARFGSDGSHRWSFRRDGSSTYFGQAAIVQVSSTDKLYLGYGAAGDMTHLELVDDGGSMIATQTVAASGASGGGWLPDGTLLIAGAFAGPVDLGGGPSTSHGSLELWFGRIAVP